MVHVGYTYRFKRPLKTVTEANGQPNATPNTSLLLLNQ